MTETAGRKYRGQTAAMGLLQPTPAVFATRIFSHWIPEQMREGRLSYTSLKWRIEDKKTIVIPIRPC